MAKLTGHKELDDMLGLLPDRVARKVTIQALRAGSRTLAKVIRGVIPAHHKTIRQAIGSKVDAKGGPQKNRRRARIGAAVGIKRAKQTQQAEKAKTERKLKKRRGVGISSNNIHWWLLGTEQRQQKKSGRSTGRMPAASPNPIRVGLARGDKQVFDKVRENMRRGVIRELGKIARAKGAKG